MRRLTQAALLAFILFATLSHIATVYAERPTWPWRHLEGNR